MDEKKLKKLINAVLEEEIVIDELKDAERKARNRLNSKEDKLGRFLVAEAKLPNGGNESVNILVELGDKTYEVRAGRWSEKKCYSFVKLSEYLPTVKLGE